MGKIILISFCFTNTNAKEFFKLLSRSYYVLTFLIYLKKLTLKIYAIKSV